MGFHIPKKWQILKHFAESFHQAQTFYFWRVVWQWIFAMIWQRNEINFVWYIVQILVNIFLPYLCTDLTWTKDVYTCLKCNLVNFEIPNGNDLGTSKLTRLHFKQVYTSFIQVISVQRPGKNRLTSIWTIVWHHLKEPTMISHNLGSLLIWPSSVFYSLLFSMWPFLNFWILCLKN